MNGLLKIPEQCRLYKTIPNDKFGGVSDYANQIVWMASIKQPFVNMVPSVEGNIRYEEIEILDVSMNGTDNLYDVVKVICKEIKYPCLLILRYSEKHMLAICEFDAGKTYKDENSNLRILLSHWMHSDLLSLDAKKFYDEVNKILNKEGTVKEVYADLKHAIQSFQLSGISRAHVDRLLVDLLGTSKNRDSIMKYCTPYKKYEKKGAGLGSKDSSDKSKNYQFRYDIEDIWYCLSMDERTKKILRNRRYYSGIEILYYIDSKGW